MKRGQSARAEESWREERTELPKDSQKIYEERKWRKPDHYNVSVRWIQKKRFKEQRAAYQDPLAVIGFIDRQQLS